MDHYAKAYPIFSRIKGIEEVRRMLNSLKRFSKDGVAKERLRIINFYEQYGERTTKNAFGVGRNTIFVWRKRLRQNHNTLSSLIPDSTVPKSKRKMLTHPQVTAYIRNIREKHPRLGKEKIKPLLDKYCQVNNLPAIKESTIGKVIKRNNLYFQKAGRIYHNPQHAYSKRKRTKRLRVRYAPKPTDTGYLEMDTVLYFVDGIRNYFYSAIDVKSKFAFSYWYKHLNSQNTVDFFNKVEKVCPFSITKIQTDNGLEFFGDFDSCLKAKAIPHVFIYPRCCRINGVVERYQRSLQEEYIDQNLDIIHNPILFTRKLIEYLLFYNTQRVHKSLKLQTPMQYLILNDLMYKNSVTYTFI